MNIADKEALRRLGAGESIANVCSAAGLTRAEFDAWWKSQAQERVPAMSGTRRAKLSRPVRIERDKYGIPHIHADNESDLFFGREGQSDELARKLGQTRFVAVVGTSGSGKSSLVRAGLLPSLDSGCLVKAGSSWRVVDMRPGGDPIHNLAKAVDVAGLSDVPVDPEVLSSSSLALLRIGQAAYKTNRLQDDECLLILVDQFEELFRYKTRDTMQDRDQKAAFVKLLLEASKQRKITIYVVITMRSEFLGDCASFRDWKEQGPMIRGGLLDPGLRRSCVELRSVTTAHRF